MPGICGLLSLRNTNDITSDFNAIFQSMCRFGHARAQTHRSSSACFGMVSLASAIIRNPDEKIFTTPNSIFLTSNPQLDDFVSVAKALKQSARDMENQTAAEILRQLCISFTPDVFRSAYGNWSLASYIASEKRLTLVREPFGTSELYYLQSGGYFAFASSLGALLEISRVNQKPSDKDLILNFMGYESPGNDGSETPFANIKRLPPGCRLTFDGRYTKVQRYWSLAADLKENKLDRVETIEKARHLLQSAVDRSVYKFDKVGATLSSGFDSGIVSTMAAQNSRLHVDAYCSKPLFPESVIVAKGRFADESPLAQCIADKYPNMHLHLVTAKDITPLQGVARSVDCYPEKLHANTNEYWLHALFESAQRDGVTRVLNGQLGNLTLSYRAPVELISTIRAIRSLRWNLMVRRFARLPAVSVLRKKLAMDETSKLQQEVGKTPSPINPDLLLRLGISPLSPTETNFDSGLYADDPRLSIISPHEGHGYEWTEIGAMYGMDVVDPTADTAFTIFALSIQPDFFLGPTLENKYLARSIGQDLLPEKVLSLKLRGQQAADIVARLIADAETMESTLSSFEADGNIARFLNIAEMRTVWQKLLQGNTLSTQTLAWEYLFPGVAFGLFLKRWIYR